MDDDYFEQSRKISEEWRSTVREHLLPNYRDVAHLAGCLTSLAVEAVEANELFSGALDQRTKDVLIEIADELNEKLSSLDGLPGARYMGHEANKTLSQMRVASGRFGFGKQLKTIGANELAALKLATERFQVEVKGLEDTVAYEGSYNEPTIAPIVTATDCTTTPKKRPAYDRDHAFLQWYEAPNTSTYHSHAGIADKWNNTMNPEQREAVCRYCTARVTREVVVKAVRKAKEERGQQKS